MRTIGYTADASAFCPECAIELYNGLLPAYSGHEYENTVDEYGHLYGFDHEGNEIHPIFSTDESPDGDTYCDACRELIIECTMPTLGN